VARNDDRLLIVWVGPVTLVNRRRSQHWSISSTENAALRGFFGAAARRMFRDLGQTQPWDSITVEFMLTTKNDRHPDTDAVAGAAKSALDGIVDADVIADDTGRHVRSVTFHAPETTGESSLRCLVKHVDV